MITRKDDQTLTLREHMRGGNGTVQIRNLCKELPPKMRLFAQITLTPGTSIGFHTHEGETELFNFIAGSGVVMDDTVEARVNVGDSLSTGNGKGHSVRNDGDVDLVMIAAISLD